MNMLKNKVNEAEMKQIKGYKAQGFKRVPVSRETPLNGMSPVKLLKKLKHKSSNCFSLELMKNGEQRYTYLGFKPQARLIAQAGNLSYEDLGEGKHTVKTNQPNELINEIIGQYHSPKRSDFPPFSGGLAGYFSYSYMQYGEPSLKLSTDDSQFPDLELLLFNELIVFDKVKNTIILISGVQLDTGNIEENYEQSLAKIDEMKNIILDTTEAPSYPFSLGEIKPVHSQEKFVDMVNKTKSYINKKEVDQVVVANTQTGKTTGSLLNTYSVLRNTNPSPYTFYLGFEDTEIAGSSPETLVQLENRQLMTYPLAGTRPRGETPEEDEQLETELLNDPKELAEHNMLVELSKIDMGKISEEEKIKVQEYLNIIRFSHVMHIGSIVQGELKNERTPLDAIDAMLPAGTLSGSPKVRATEIIQEVEGKERGIYGGGIGYIDFSGDLDIGISIRLAYQKNNQVYVQSGAGIVEDSVPEKEYIESINKAKAVIEALEQAEG